MPNMIQAKFNHSCCLGYDGHLYALGGYTLSNDSTNNAERFNCCKSAWEIIRPMKQSRTNFATIATPRGIFVIGGHTSKKFLREVEFYDYEDDRWTEKASLQQARCYHTAILSKDYETITVFGGLWDKNTILESIEVYNIASN